MNFLCSSFSVVLVLAENCSLLCYGQVEVAGSLLDSGKNRPWSKHSKQPSVQPQLSVPFADDKTVKFASEVISLICHCKLIIIIIINHCLSAHWSPMVLSYAE